MPRAARAILAIACSAGALRPDVGLVEPSGFSCGRGKQLELLRQKWRSRLRVASEHDEASSWLGIDDNEECPKLQSEDDDSSEGASSDESESDAILPEALVTAVLAYAGVQGRRACRTSRKQCDISLHDSLQLPEFPVNIRIKQHYQFGTEQSATSTWSLDVSSASGDGTMELRTEVSSDEQVETSSEKSKHSNGQMMDLWRQLQILRSDVGVRHKESGESQVEIEVIDASNRVFLEHGYKRRAFYNKADEILEILTGTDAVEAVPLVESTAENRVVLSRYSGSRSASRPV
jgi:hypothetical protein|mmetsp:Transcript_114729/g.180643  ORF Transcript_114729/g.180643 Transcript_114729/m.180643 type:complete len:291 (-) Transcript_114729:267-1139(-)|eukprot:CAMPEP_0169108400 /NCGR_PEP_ID=MMETSP1015-20121227/25408_1 /TAXON_ID=342587 /ORGANISM="Karlodinium micrum, Strain CCMP2283" /LENGTH=290 /DNA_ID=CAMNT_0009170021 /DNA_START=64 /DNA_END=936 /DNA_ORIENTATION=-